MIHLVFHESLCMNLFVLITPITFPIQCSIRTGDQAEVTRYGFQSKMEILLLMELAWERAEIKLR